MQLHHSGIPGPRDQATAASGQLETDAYPAALDMAIAEAAVTMISGQVPRLSSPKEGSRDIQRGTLEEEVHKTIQTGSKSGVGRYGVRGSSTGVGSCAA